MKSLEASPVFSQEMLAPTDKCTPEVFEDIIKAGSMFPEEDRSGRSIAEYSSRFFSLRSNTEDTEHAATVVGRRDGIVMLATIGRMAVKFKLGHRGFVEYTRQEIEHYKSQIPHTMITVSGRDEVLKYETAAVHLKRLGGGLVRAADAGWPGRDADCPSLRPIKI